MQKKHGASSIDVNENAHFCTRRGCSGRIKYAPNSNIRTHYHSPSSTSTSITMNAGKSSPDSKGKLPLQLKNAHSNSSLSTGWVTASSGSNLSENERELQEIGLPKRTVSIATSTHKPCIKNKGVVSSTPSAPSRISGLKLSNSTCGTRARLDHGNMKSNSKSCYPGIYPSRASKSLSDSSMKKISAEAGSSSSRVEEKTDLNSTTTISILRNKGNSASNQRGSSSLSSRDKMSSMSMRRPPSHNEGNHSLPGQMLGASNSSSYSFPTEYRWEPTTMPPSRTLGAVPFAPTNWDLLHHYGINGSAEILSAIARIERDESMTPEQILLEVGILLSNLTSNDRHRGMRLDIDNMSYEDLLALEERMGSVSAPLSQEELSKCLKKSVYQQNLKPQPEGSSGINFDDTKCSICQEEYVIRDKMGVLSECCHQYHETCIRQWLRLKNWCPICKASASTSPPSSSL